MSAHCAKSESLVNTHKGLSIICAQGAKVRLLRSHMDHDLDRVRDLVAPPSFPRRRPRLSKARPDRTSSLS